MPYMYNHLRRAYDDGISILRPMYYEQPNLDMAYKADDSGNFGTKIGKTPTKKFTKKIIFLWNF